MARANYASVDDEIAAKQAEIEGAREDVAAEAKESLAKAEQNARAKQLVFDGLRVNPEITTTFRGSVKLTGVPKQKGGTKVRGEFFGTVSEIRVKDHNGDWRLQQIIVPIQVDLLDDKGELLGRSEETIG